MSPSRTRQMALLPALLPVAALAETCPELTALQRAAGYLTWMHALQLLAVALGAAGVLLFCSGLVRRFLQHVGAVEVLLWSLVVASLGGAWLLEAAWQPWVVTGGSLLLPGAAALSIWRRKLVLQPLQGWAALALAWSAAALAYGLPAVGFLAVLAMMGWLGFSAAVGPFCYFLGFRDGNALARCTVAGALVALAAAGLAVLQVDLGPARVFEAGALWLGGFTWFLGALVASVRWFHQGNYLLRQLLAVASYGIGLTLGLLGAINALSTLATAFGLFWVAGKIIEVSVNGRIALGLKLATAGGMLAGVWYVAQPML